MRIAAMILGIIGGLAGLVGALFVFILGGLAAAVNTTSGPTGSQVVAMAGTALACSILGIVGGSLALARPRASGILMIVAAVGGIIAISLGYVIAGPLLLIGGILALVGKKPAAKTAT